MKPCRDCRSRGVNGLRGSHWRITLAFFYPIGLLLRVPLPVCFGFWDDAKEVLLARQSWQAGIICCRTHVAELMVETPCRPKRVDTWPENLPHLMFVSPRSQNSFEWLRDSWR